MDKSQLWAIGHPLIPRRLNKRGFTVQEYFRLVLCWEVCPLEVSLCTVRIRTPILHFLNSSRPRVAPSDSRLFKTIIQIGLVLYLDVQFDHRIAIVCEGDIWVYGVIQHLKS